MKYQDQARSCADARAVRAIEECASLFARAAACIVAACVVAMFSIAASGQEFAWAVSDAAVPSVLIVDAGLGDYELAGLHWLGEDAEAVAEDQGLALTTSQTPQWWNDGTEEPAEDAPAAPATFLLGSPQARALTAQDIVWALDAIRESGAEPRTFVVSVGGTGIALREYAEDLADVKQSSRADIVGLAFCGTPQNGYSTIEMYPEQDLWEAIGDAAGLSLEDLDPQSVRLKAINAGSFPRMTKTLSVSGAVGDMGFGLTDGAGVPADFAMPESVTDQVMLSQVSATIARQVNLTSFWEPFTSSINYAGRSVDGQLVARLSGIDSYETSEEVQAIVRDFYRTWFSERMPVTHNSNVLLLDLSGSMVEDVAGAGDKLTAAKEAAAQYLQAMQECSELPQSAPMDVAVFGFNETIVRVTEGYEQSSIDALDTMSAHSETNIGIALDQALSTLEQAPTCADKRILLLSDGESTRGKSDDEIIASSVSTAVERGIVIDAIGFGDAGESDAAFLERVANATGGTYYQASDTYTLKVNFLKSYYSSLGFNLFDEEIAGSGSVVQDLGSVDAQTSALQVGVIANGFQPEVKLLRDGSPVDETLYAVQQDNGLISVQCTEPMLGAYSLELSGVSGPAHVFAVTQPGVVRVAEIEGEQVDYSLLLLIGFGAALVIAIVAVVARTARKPRRATGSSATVLPDSRSGWRNS